MIDQQHALEAEMRGLGIEAYRRDLASARADGRESGTSYGQSLLKRAIRPLVEAIEEMLNAPKTGPRSVAKRKLDDMEPDVAALITAKVILDSITAEAKLTKVAVAIGQALEDEQRFSKFEDINGVLFHATKRALRKRTSNAKWQRKILQVTMNNQGMDWDGWTHSDKLHLGLKLIDLFINSTEFIQLETIRERRSRTVSYLRATPELMAWIDSNASRCEVLSPMFMPCIVPPKPWTGAWGGGYHTKVIRPLPLVKASKAGYLEEMDNRVDEMKLVYQAINAIQETPWRVNRDVLSVMRAVWDNKLPIGGLPNPDDEGLPACPVCHGNVRASNGNHPCFERDKDAHVRWKRAAAEVYENNAKNRSKRLQVAKVIWLGEKFAQYPAIYFPHQLDFRGRVYAVPQQLNPQGADWSRALLTFAEGKPIDGPDTASWLAIHGANSFGVDKVAFNDRVAWVEEHEPEICAVAQDPLANTFWSDADNPWQFLAFCFEWAALLEHGYGYVSTLPVQLDGTCNGLQHFSAMLRDPVGGKAVNLVPGETPEDIYQRVADKVIEKLQAIEATAKDVFLEEDTKRKAKGANDVKLAREWLTYGINRKVTKRPVMVLPYGGTMHSCREYINAYIVETGGSPWPKGQTFKAAIFLAPIVWAAIGEVVVAARKAMAWLQKVASVVSKENIPILWTTPLGFPVMQSYQDYKDRQIETKISGMVIKPRVREEIAKVDRHRQVNGISPNFVHSLDACALMAYVVMAKEQGINHFSLVHDSYGTLAADTALSASLLRQAFVTIYKDTDPLANFLEDVKQVVSEKDIPAMPPKGTLDIDAVLTSRYFFA
jgi:DNA-directed RNA polymerase